MFCGSQPRVLNASVTPIASAPELVAFTRCASSAALFAASTVTFPPMVSVLPMTCASAPPITVFVAISPLAASEVPPPNLLPPEELAALSRDAVMFCAALALTLTSPALAVSVVSSIEAVAPPRRSFNITAPAAPTESELLKGEVLEVEESELRSSVASSPEASVALTVTPAAALIVFAPV